MAVTETRKALGFLIVVAVGMCGTSACGAGQSPPDSARPATRWAGVPKTPDPAGGSSLCETAWWANTGDSVLARMQLAGPATVTFILQPSGETKIAEFPAGGSRRDVEFPQSTASSVEVVVQVGDDLDGCVAQKRESLAP